MRESFSWFSHSPNRRYDYRQLWETLEPDSQPLKLVAPATTRWLSLSDCIIRILDQWDVLKLHFGLAAKNERCYSARILHDMYADSTNRLYLQFLSPVLAEFAEMNKLFQHREADQYKLSTDLQSFASGLLKRIVRPDLISFDIDLDNPMVFLPMAKVDFGYVFENEMQSSVSAGKVTVEQKSVVLTRCFQFLKISCKEVIKRLPTLFDTFAKLQFLTPEKCLSVTDKPKFS
jgi:hypothetical protein